MLIKHEMKFKHFRQKIFFNSVACIGIILLEFSFKKETKDGLLKSTSVINQSESQRKRNDDNSIIKTTIKDVKFETKSGEVES